MFWCNTSGGTIRNKSISNKKLTEEYQKPVIRNFNKRKKYSRFIDKIWSEDLVDWQLISKFNKV